VNARLQARILPDGRRLHLNDGPIDLVIEAWGEADAVSTAYRAARDCMDGLLDGLCGELPVLRGTAGPAGTSVGRRMQAAVAPYRAKMFITPMAAVAGSVADEVLAAMTEAAVLERAYVNNGGDIALHLSPGTRLALGAVDRPDRPALFGRANIEAGDGVCGIATSGWRGRSFSLGIADAVTVLAGCAAVADAAATVIANAVDIPDLPTIGRVPAETLDPMSDLGDRLVTRSVPPLSPARIDAALASGAAVAAALVATGQIVSAALHLQGETRVEGGRVAAIAAS
jgi:ApbE superfamily uncharacterized protein (UPF0280 family)